MTDVSPIATPERTDEPRPSGTAGVWLAAAASALIALVLAGTQIPGRPDFCLDDAWIHLAYAKSLRLGDGFSYNPGDLETGFSSPLWALMLAALPHGTAPVTGVKLLGAGLHALTALVTALVAGRLVTRVEHGNPSASLAPEVVAAGVAGVLTATTPCLLQGATSGMEVPLAACLVSCVVLAMVTERWGWAACAGLLSVWARPEALFVVGAASGLAFITSRRWTTLTALAGGATALGSWVVYCLVVSGHPWPNTRYIKASEPGLSGLGFYVREVLPDQPWAMGLGGVGLLGLALWMERRKAASSATEDAHARVSWLSVIAGVWVATVVATAVSRPLHLGTLFFETRYFAPVAQLPLVLVGVGAAAGLARRWVVPASLVPVLALTAIGWVTVREEQFAQELSIHRLHTVPAKWVRDHIRPETVIAVEGAGAQRYFTPRAMTVVDIIGLNDAGIAHAPSSEAKLCVLFERSPRLLVAPSQIVAPLAAAFEGTIVEEFRDPDYAQVKPRHPALVQAVALGEPRARWRQICAGPAEGSTR